MASRTPPIDPDEPTRPARSWPRRLAKILASLLLLLTLLEVGLRATLFTGNARLRKATSKLRSASNFSHRWSPEYWKLLRLFANGPRQSARHDPILGWLQHRIELGSYKHEDHDPGNGKRPVLLYGDSFAECVTGPDDCWEGLLARSDLGETHQLINYGTGGHGFGQTYLMLRESIANYADESPIVIVSLLVNDDMDRAILPFRAWPKPRFTIEADGSLSLSGPVPEGALDYLEEHPPAITSYLWRYLVHGTDLIPAAQRVRLIAKAEAFAETQRLNRRILEEIKDTLDATDVEYFVLVFYAKGYFTDPPPDDWRERFLLSELERLEMPYVSSRSVMDADMLATERRARDYFHLRGAGKGHYDPQGNQVVFEAIRLGLQQRFEGQADPDSIDAPSARSHTRPAAFARYGTEAMRPFLDPEDTPRWVLGTDGDTPTDLDYRLHAQVASFSAILKLVPPAAHGNAGPIELSLWKDGERVQVHSLEAPATPIPIDLDLTGTHEFRIRASSPAGTAGDVLLLASPAFSRVR